MSQSPEIQFDCGPEGITVSVNGYSGPGCEQLTEQIERELGTAGERIHKPEYHDPVQQQHAAQQKAGQ